MKKSLIGLLVVGALVIVGCTFSFNNISTKGQASDVVDEEQAQDVSPNVEIPIPQ